VPQSTVTNWDNALLAGLTIVAFLLVGSTGKMTVDKSASILAQRVAVGRNRCSQRRNEAFRRNEAAIGAQICGCRAITAATWRNDAAPLKTRRRGIGSYG